MPSILKDLRLNNSYSWGEKNIYYNLWIVQSTTLYLSPETKFSKATTIKKWVVKLFICFYRPPCATHCAEHDAIYKWEQWWLGQFVLMWRRSWEVGSEEVGGGSTFKQTLHSNSCDSFMSFSWPVARSHILVILIGLSNTQIFDHDLVSPAMISDSSSVLMVTTSSHSTTLGWLLQLSSSWSFDDIKIFCAILDTCPVIKVLS